MEGHDARRKTQTQTPADASPVQRQRRACFSTIFLLSPSCPPPFAQYLQHAPLLLLLYRPIDHPTHPLVAYKLGDRRVGPFRHPTPSFSASRLDSPLLPAGFISDLNAPRLIRDSNGNRVGSVLLRHRIFCGVSHRHSLSATCQRRLSPAIADVSPHVTRRDVMDC